MELITPWEKVLCPHCFKKFRPSDCPVVSEVDGSLLAAAPKGLKKRYRSFVWEQLGGDDVFRRPRLQCPGCKRNWPKDIELAENHIVALVGGTGAGKSNYIAMVIDQLKNNARVKQAIGVARIRALSGAIENRYLAFYNSLIQNRQVLPRTQEAQVKGGIDEPLIYRLEFAQSAGERRPVYLYLYDVAGEDITDENKALEFSRFLFHASALILLADPFAMPKMRQYIHEQFYPTNLPNTRPSEVLFRVVELYETRTRAKLSIPLAITISKSDMLQFADPQRRSSLFATPTYYNPNYSHPLQTQELEQVSDDVKRLLQVYGDTELVSGTEQYEDKVGFFAVSATGWPPDPLTSIYPAIEPLRCLDPLLWALQKLDLIQAV